MTPTIGTAPVTPREASSRATRSSAASIRGTERRRSLRRHRAHPLAAGLAAAALFLALGFAVAQDAQDAQDTYPLPGDAVYPEGIAVDAAAGVFYVGSANDGTIFRVDIASGETSVFVPAGAASFTTLGMDVDGQGRLWVAGGGSGKIRVYDTATGDLLATVDTPPADATFLNDVVVAKDGTAYVTDSNRPVLFRIGPDMASAESFVDFDGTPVSYEDGFNLNGIDLTSDGRYLITVQSNTGKLFRIGVHDGAVERIDVSAEMIAQTFPGGDGLALHGDHVYVVSNASERIDVIALSQNATKGEKIKTITDPALAFPASASWIDGHLLVVNTQFDTRNGGTPELPFTVARIAVP